MPPTKETSSTPSASASPPLPTIPDRDLAARQEGLDQHRLAEGREQVGAGPAQTPARSATLERPVTPLELPSAAGLTNSGKGRSVSRAPRSSAHSTTAKAGVGRPWSRTSRLASGLSRVSAQVSGSEKV